MQCSEIGIIGLGTMGRGIAEVVLAAGYRVTALGRDDASCKSHIAEFSNSVHRLARLKRFPEDVANKLSDRLLPAGNLGELDRCSLVIESIPENL
ncbi:MAG: 3-hydroxyacyl-CoA dehydrogenase NAD-binding domain-containing protein, partial [Dehalococcoidales bacterium]